MHDIETIQIMQGYSQECDFSDDLNLLKASEFEEVSVFPTYCTYITTIVEVYILFLTY